MCEHVLRDLKIIDEEKRIVRCECGEIFNETPQMFSIIKTMKSLVSTIEIIKTKE